MGTKNKNPIGKIASLFVFNFWRKQMLKITNSQRLPDPLPYSGNLQPGTTPNMVNVPQSSYESFSERGGSIEELMQNYDPEVVVQALAKAISDNASEGYSQTNEGDVMGLAEQDYYKPVSYKQAPDGMQVRFVLKKPIKLNWVPDEVSVYLPEIE
jgi:hypothetical protein